MRTRQKLTFVGLLIVVLTVVVIAGCGGGAGGPGGAAQSNQVLAGPPAGWEGHPPFHVRRSQTSGPVGYTPAQVRHAYGFDLITGNGAHQTIAIVDAYGSPTIQKDLAVFSTQFGLPAATLTIAYPGGKPNKTDGGWALETSLDVEWAHAIAPGASILLVVSKSASISALLNAVDYASARAAQVSMSWGGNEFQGEASYDSHFSTAGVTFTASSGDSGGGAQWPAASPYVTAVGGTTLKLDGVGNTLSETAWSGSNGGTSAYEAMPSYQTGWQSNGTRTMPDVSYLADPNTGVPVYDSTKYQGASGWFEVGGTSAGAPQWAALIALVNGGRVSALNGTNARLYTLAGTPTNYNTSNDYRDITQGSNQGFSASTGYDLVTGLGSPMSASLVPGLVSSSP